MSSSGNQRNKVFISYSHKDQKWLKRLNLHLKPLGHAIDIWDDTKIRPGSKWQDEIKEAIACCRVAVLLISVDFLASDFIMDDELPPLLAAAERDGTKILPLIVGPCRFEETKTLSQFQAINAPSKTLKDMTEAERERLFVHVTKVIETVLAENLVIEIVPTPKDEPVGKIETPYLPQELPKLLSTEDLLLLEKLKSEFRDVNRRKFTFLIVGRAGVGKSSTINGLMGEKVAEVGTFKKTTNKVARYDGVIHGIRYSIVDTPGLGDADPKEGNDERYLAEIKRKVQRIDCMWFVTRLDEPRVRADEISTIKLISATFGEKIWKNSVIVFTFADKVRSEKYLEWVVNRSGLIRAEIAEHAGKRIAKAVPIVAVSNDEDTHEPRPLPNGKMWLGELYTEVFLRISDEGAVPFFFATASRIAESGAKGSNSRSIGINKEQQKKIEERAKNIPMLRRVGQALNELGRGFWAGAKRAWDVFRGRQTS